MVKKIALEEHFLSPGFTDYWQTTAGDITPDMYRQAVARLSDFGDMRLEVMDRGGIARSVLAISGPGVQIERDTATAVRKAKQSNDFLAGEIAKRPTRYSGFAHVALQDAVAAADELERAMGDLGFVGAMINGHTNGQYLDHPALHPFWERAQALGAVIYLHPADPIAAMPVLEGTKGLKRAGWEWGVETGSHALRLVYSGAFRPVPPRHPGARPSRRDPAVSPVASRRQGEVLRREARPATVGLHPRQHRGDDFRHVLPRAADVRDIGTRP